MDERSIIIEQDRQKREQKKRKNRKKKRIAIAVVSLLGIGGVWYLFWGKNLQTVENQNQVEIIARSGEEIIFAQLNSINGNEITYTVAEKGEDTDVTNSVEDRTMRSSNGKSGGKAETTYIPVGTDVTTKLGAVTTFSRLAAGDNVALVVTTQGEEKIILGIYIIG